MRANPRRTIVLASSVATVLLLVACERELLVLPEFPDVGPYMHQPACVACLQDKCAEQWTACMSEQECEYEYECRADCTEPYCHMDCRREAVPALTDAERWAAQDPLAIQDLGACATKVCVDECAVGRDFRCVGVYEEQAESADEIQVASFVLELPGKTLVPGMTASACAPSDRQCMDPITTHDASGGAFTMRLRRETGDFREHFMFKTPSADDHTAASIAANYNWQTLPRSVGRTAGQYVFPRWLAAQVWTLQKLDFDVQRPGMSVVAYDCSGSLAVGLRVEVDADCSPFPRCDFYWEGGAPQPGLEATRADEASATLALPANEIHDVRLVDVATGRLVGRFMPSMAPATQHSWWVYPLTGRQMSDVR